MSRANGSGDDRVVPFRRPGPPRPSLDWRRPLAMFAGLFGGVLVLRILLSGTGVTPYNLIFAGLFALILTSADLYRRRKGL